MKGRPRKQKKESMKQYSNRLRLWNNLNKGKLTSVEDEEMKEAVNDLAIRRPKKECRNCLHWQIDSPSTGGLTYGNKEGPFGMCTLQPTWANTSDTHYCGQFNGSKK